MKDLAFFFQGDMLLLPADFPDPLARAEVPLELAECFKNPDIFTIPALGECPGSSQDALRAASVLPGTEIPGNWKSVSVRQVLAIRGGADQDGATGRMLRACHIARWRQDSRFCGSCGAANIDVPGEAVRRCSACGREEFPRISPAVIIIITDDENRILLAHNKKFKAGLYSLIAGFNEAGESLEETVAREIREEVNIEVKDAVYIRSQPWPFPNSLMTGFSARYLSGEVHPDGVEIEDARWFDRSNLPELPGEGSLSRFLIKLWLEGKV
ncbi:MAG: NAD(+) diphosphatase [Treponema sp.]|nr:NAD(+) diphosphatase [Treponema sp.]